MKVRTREQTPKEEKKKHYTRNVSVFILFFWAISWFYYLQNGSGNVWGYMLFLLLSYITIFLLYLFFIFLVSKIRKWKDFFDEYLYKHYITHFENDVLISYDTSLHSNNLSQSMNYFPSKEIKKAFISYLFWKKIKIANRLFLASSILFFIYFIETSLGFISLGSIAWISIWIWVLFWIVIQFPFFYYLKNMQSINILCLSIHPESYYWKKNKKTLYFK